jgi:hypothetical protein
MYDSESLVRKIYRHNGYTVMDFQWALNPSNRSHSQEEMQNEVAAIPYV